MVKYVLLCNSISIEIYKIQTQLGNNKIINNYILKMYFYTRIVHLFILLK